MTTTYTADKTDEVINEYITAVYAVKYSDEYKQTKERQELISELAGYILASYEAKTGG